MERTGKIILDFEIRCTQHDGEVQSVECPVGCSVLFLSGVLHAGAGESEPLTYEL